MKQWIIWFVVLPFVGSWGGFVLGFGIPTDARQFVRDLRSIPAHVEAAVMSVISDTEGMAADWDLDLEGRFAEVGNIVEELNPFGNGLVKNEIRGPARVIDGDTMEVDGKRIRMFGIDAPESGQECIRNGKRWRCGASAGQVLTRWASGKEVACREMDRDKYGRVVGVCFMGKHDLNAAMVSSGWALAFRRYSNEYVEEENWAKANGKGIWGSRFEPPWDWRRRQSR